MSLDRILRSYIIYPRAEFTMKSPVARMLVCSFLLLIVKYVLSVEAAVVEKDDDLFPVSIIHINDFHARFEETSLTSTACKEGEECVGGYARIVTTVKKLQDTRPNPIYLNAGDNFQGTLWYSFGRWNVTSMFLNMLKADAITLGNHEFDNMVAGVIPFMEALESPVVVANIDDTDEPDFQGKYQKTLIIDRYERTIGIIGIIISNVNEISNTGKLKFYNEEETIRREAQLFKEQGVDIVIALTHCGIDVDYRIAKGAAPYVDVIVGGHSHTYMYTEEEGSKAPGPDLVKDKYPAVVETDGHKVLIVQASVYAKYVGDLTVYFDKAGNVAKWEGAPIYLDRNVVEDPEIMEAIKPWKEIIDTKGKRIVGFTKVPLLQVPCKTEECNMGNMVADALVHHFITEVKKDGEPWAEPIIGLVPYGAVRTTLYPGEISYNDLATVVPFENSIDTFELLGKYVVEMFEHAAKETWQSQDKLDILHLTQVSGAKIVYNMTNEPMHRVVSVEVLEIVDNVPRYMPIDPEKYYNCIASCFLADGGDGFKMVSDNKRNHERGLADIEVVVKYFEHHKYIYTGLENRLTFV